MTTLRQLEYLVAVVDEGSFTRAAELLHLTQPALSHQIRALEQSTGGLLLERLPRSVRLTPMGRAMLPHARAALADADRARTAARQVASLEQGELRLATLYSISIGVLPPALKAWRQEHGDGIAIRLFEHRHADELAAAMTAGQADLAVGPAPEAWTGPVRELGVEEFVVVLAQDDPIEDNNGTIALNQLRDRDWVHYAPSNGLADILNRHCAAAGFQPRAAVRTEQTAAAPVLAAAGLGPALVPSNVLSAHFDGRVLRPDPPILRTLTAYTRDAPDPIAAAFIELLEAETF